MEKKIDNCPECGSTSIRHVEGALICDDCGLYYAELLPEEEKRYTDVNTVVRKAKKTANKKKVMQKKVPVKPIKTIRVKKAAIKTVKRNKPKKR